MQFNLTKVLVTSGVAIGLALGGLTPIASADDGQVRADIQRAVGFFQQRNPTDQAPISEALKILGELELSADDSDLNYDIYILESRALYWKGTHVKDVKEKMAVFAEAQAKADAAKAINNGYADGYYFAAINLARWAEARGIEESVPRRQELVDYVNAAKQKMTRLGASGETIDGNGPDRVFGKMYASLPGGMGGDYKVALTFFRKAVEGANRAGYRVALNTFYLAELLAAKVETRGEARRILEELLAETPENYNPARIPENKEEFAECKALLEKIR